MAKIGYLGRNPNNSNVVISKSTTTATGITTDFTVNGGYTVGYIDVYLNGIRLVEREDYYATNGTTVGLTTNAINGDQIEFVGYKAFNIGNPSTAIGIASAGSDIRGYGTGLKTLNFVGAGNTFAIKGDTVDISISGGGGGSVGVSSNSLTTYVGTSVTHFNFIGAAVTAIGAGTTMNVTINKLFSILARDGLKSINVTSGIATIALRSGLAGTITF